MKCPFVRLTVRHILEGATFARLMATGLQYSPTPLARGTLGLEW